MFATEIEESIYEAYQYCCQDGSKCNPGWQVLVVLEGSQPRPVKEDVLSGTWLIKWGTKKVSGEFVEMTFIALSRSFGVELEIFALKI